VDRSPEQIGHDIALMQQAGFTLVRMGDLSWDAFEPSEGHFEFAWFDNILEQMNQAGIKVILDIGGSPAPIWLHHKYPSVNMVNELGATVQPAERYTCSARTQPLRRPPHREGTGDSFRRLRARG
jgi:beta-galactosidase